jgi:hypothetical protein
MRLALTLTAAAVALTACQSEEQLKQTYRQQILSSCTTEMAPRMASMPGIDAQRFCTCIADRSVTGRSAEDLRKLEGDQASARQAGEQAAAQCVAEQMGGAAATGAAATESGAAATANAAENAEEDTE